MIKLLAILAFTVYTVTAQASITLGVSQDFAVANNGYSGAQITKPDQLSFFNNGFQSSVSYFGFDLSQMVLFDSSSMTSAVLTFKNFTLRESSAAIKLTLLNYGQVFDEDTVTLNTQPTSQGTLGTITFDQSVGTATMDIKTQLLAAFGAGGLFGFRVDPPGGPCQVTSHRIDPNSVYIQVIFGGAATTTQEAASTSTNAPSSPTSSGAQTTTSNAPVPSAPTTRPAGSTKAPGSSTTSKQPTAGPTSSFGPGSSSSAPATTLAPGVTDAPRSAATKISAALLCILPLAIAILL
jgi:hypothetical protein